MNRAEQQAIVSRVVRQVVQREIMIQRVSQVAHDAARRGAEAAADVLRRRGVIRPRR